MVRVLLVDEAHVAREILDEAFAHASLIYRTVGVKLVWSEIGEPSKHAFVVKIVSTSLAGTSPGDRALGIAPKGKNQRGRHAWVFYRRIEDRANVLRMSSGVLLGVVLAHEIGHLLLPRNWQSDVGLMRRTWDANHIQKAMWGLLDFTAKERELIRSRLHDSASRLAN